MITDNKIQNRKKFLGLGLTAAAMFTALRIFIPEEKKKKPETVKMLTQDGKLVEVDKEKLLERERLLCIKGKKISNEQLITWVTKK